MSGFLRAICVASDPFARGSSELCSRKEGRGLSVDRLLCERRLNQSRESGFLSEDKLRIELAGRTEKCQRVGARKRQKGLGFPHLKPSESREPNTPRYVF